jgi:hypothetical protein
MNCFLRKIAACLLLAVSMGTPFVGTAEAHPTPTRPTHATHATHARQYRVYYRADVDCPWICYGTTPNRSYAEYYASYIRYRYGYETYVY